MSPFLPKPSYLLPICTIGCIKLVEFLHRQNPSEGSFFDSVPFDWLVWCVVAFWIGLVVQDLYNRDSWIRKNVKRARQLFIIQNVNLFSESEDGFEWFEIRVRLKFIRNTGAVRIAFEVEQAVNVPHARTKFSLFSKAAPALDENKEKSFTIAVLPAKAPQGQAIGYQCWGDRFRKSGDVDGIRSLPDGTESFVKITVKSGFFFQEEKIFIALPNQHWHHAGRAWITHTQSECIGIEPIGS